MQATSGAQQQQRSTCIAASAAAPQWAAAIGSPAAHGSELEEHAGAGTRWLCPCCFAPGRQLACQTPAANAALARVYGNGTGLDTRSGSNDSDRVASPIMRWAMQRSSTDQLLWPAVWLRRLYSQLRTQLSRACASRSDREAVPGRGRARVGRVPPATHRLAARGRVAAGLVRLPRLRHCTAIACPRASRR